MVPDSAAGLQVVFQVTCVMLTAGMPVMHDPLATSSTIGVNCVDYSTERLTAILNEGWRSKTPLGRKIIRKRSIPDVPAQFMPNRQEMSRQLNRINIIDNLIPRGDYLVKEHAKLVHDINSLSQVVFVRPLIDENRDYDDSIFHDTIETATTSTIIPSLSSKFTSTTRPSSTTIKGMIPIVLVGGASQRQIIKSQPLNFVKPTVSLVGTSVSPVAKHPYPFVMHRQPVKICVTSLPQMPTPKPLTKTIWERFLDYFIPRRNLFS